MTPTQAVDLKRSWLVQRLNKPRGRAANPFSFGGGLRNGGLSPEAVDLLSGVFTFDYMGSAEFEFGAVPQALQRMAGASLATWSIEIPFNSVLPSWNDKRPAPEGKGTVYVLAPKEWRKVVDANIRAWAKGGGNTKDAVNLNTSLRPFDEWHSDTCGWLEIDNGFMFFTDADMWAKTCDIFGVAVSR
jgi:hypothetical protein